MVFYTVYKITYKVTGKFYIGKHVTRQIDDGYYGSGKALRRALKKYGREKFVKEVMFVFESEEEMNAKEKELVTEEFCLRADTYNLCVGGQGGFSYINRAGINNKGGKNAQKLAAPHIGKKLPRVSAMMRERHRLGLVRYDTFTDRTHTEATKLKLSIKGKERIGAKNGQFGTMWITNGKENRKIRSTAQIPPEWLKGRVMTFSDPFV